jgi:hypothetical protein
MITSMGIGFEKSVASIAADVRAPAIKLLGPNVLEHQIPSSIETVLIVLQ